jgi:hypothetical protein
MFQRYFSAPLVALLTAALAVGATPAQAQNDLLGDLEKTTPATEKREVVQATFKSTHIVNTQSVEIEGPGTLNFLIQHRFGTINQGPYEFFGLDQAVLRLSFEYGLTDKVALGFGRSSIGKTFDGFVKYRAIRQTTGTGAIPVSVTLFASSAIMTQKFDADNEYSRNTGSRLAYTYQALIARKFSPALSIQLMPTLVHRNYVAMSTDKNDVYAIGAGFRQKFTKRIALTGDYFYLLPSSKSSGMRNAAGLGVDIETGGHVFQLHFTNAQGMIESNFIPQTTGKVFDGDIYFGFAIARNFTVKSNLR